MRLRVTTRRIPHPRRAALSGRRLTPPADFGTAILTMQAKAKPEKAKTEKVKTEKAKPEKAKPEAKTEKAKTVKEFLERLEEPRKSEITALHQLIVKTVPKLEPTVALGMLGYGKFHYKYASGREGDATVVAIASQKNYISLYAAAVVDGVYVAEKYKDQLPKASIGKGCIRFKTLAALDLGVIARILKECEKAGGAGAVS
jgi:hypothetical protein